MQVRARLATLVSGAVLAVASACAPRAESVVAPAQNRGAYCVPHADAFQRIYNPSAGKAWFWYMNDHTFVHGPDGIWHLFGITHREPAWPHHERLFGHATAKHLNAAHWTRQAPVLEADLTGGETLLWAPHILLHEGVYFMMYCAGGDDPTRFQIKLATSSDLLTWQRKQDPLFEDGYEARDPFVLRIGGRWVMYYTATSEASGGNYVVAYRTSVDLLHWSERAIAYRDPKSGKSAGVTESPFVVVRDEGYYLFIGPRRDYVSTEVFFSRDPLHFAGPPISEIEAHAAEVVRDADGREYLSHAGWFQGGVSLAPLTWQCPPK